MKSIEVINRLKHKRELTKKLVEKFTKNSSFDVKGNAVFYKARCIKL